jgi:hypothetical protein
MDPNLKLVLGSIGQAVAVIIVINILGFALALVMADEIHQVGFKHGAFSVNGQYSGIYVFSKSGRVIMALMFLGFFFKDWKRARRTAS